MAGQDRNRLIESPITGFHNIQKAKHKFTLKRDGYLDIRINRQTN